MSAPHELAMDMLVSFREQTLREQTLRERSFSDQTFRERSFGEQHAGTATALAPAPAALGPAVTVDPYTPRTVPHDLLTTLEHRRSLRGFSPEPLPAGLLADLMARALDLDGDLDEDGAGCPLELTVVAHRLTGITPAIHRFDAAARSFTPVMDLPTGAARYGLTLQPEFSDAAAIISIGVPLDAAIHRHGGHGYRLLLTRAGSAAYAMWLDGVAHGLVGSVFAGFIPAAVRGPLLSDGTSRQQIFALALGLPPAP
ncbi:nitroreductase family protein [Streptomyces sp. P9(2023)]|uniref:nitroreductase family protein n=1 Tax=Streptomyces sp. P9(2023) TaxID=3064394 RepID=UPI0028F3E8BF|nr:nitroreductase family protein [Streptomyces sp. P9(2023)]MDT9689111.1 nitroreductase family protein [Streptomyces sp. P9(2023)]